MKLNEYYGYIGRLKQPLQYPDVDRPTMFMVSDSLRTELDLILLTPGTFLHAYKYILSFKPQMVMIFVPSLRPEFISDVFNLYMLLKDTMPIKCVFPHGYDHYDFDNGILKTDVYMNKFSRWISFRYEENENLDDVYDIVVNCENETNYFSMYMTEELAKSLYENDDINIINIPMSSTLYGGLNYTEVLKINRKYRTKFRPSEFSSIDEMYKTLHREKPDDKFFDDPDDEKFPEDYTGDITDQEIIDMMREEDSEIADNEINDILNS